MSKDDIAADPSWLAPRMEWFRDQKFGLFMHWGICSLWGICESWPLSPADTWARPDTMRPWIERDRDLERFSADYRALNAQFNPQSFNPESWAAAAKYAGMRYVCFTTKHHDGFCMFDTRTTEFRITHPSCAFHAHPRANVTREIFDAFRAEQFGVWCYFSKSDWHVPWYWRPEIPVVDRNPNYDPCQEPECWERFVQYTHAQLRELLSEYGPIDVLWLDGGQVRPPEQDIRMHEIAAWGRELQPGLIIADRTVGGRYENFITPEQTVPTEPLDAPWESCVTMGPTFSYGFDDRYKPTRQLIHLLIDIVAKGGNLLLNIAPSPDGEFAPEAYERLREIGDWMAIHGEAIHGTRPIRPCSEGPLRFTSKGHTAYAFILAGPDSCEIAGSVLRLHQLQPADGSQVMLLGYDRPLAWQRLEDHVAVTIPADAPCSAAAPCLKFQLSTL